MHVFTTHICIVYNIRAIHKQKRRNCEQNYTNVYENPFQRPLLGRGSRLTLIKVHAYFHHPCAFTTHICIVYNIRAIHKQKRRNREQIYTNVYENPFQRPLFSRGGRVTLIKTVLCRRWPNHSQKFAYRFSLLIYALCKISERSVKICRSSWLHKVYV